MILLRVSLFFIVLLLLPDWYSLYPHIHTDISAAARHGAG